MGVNGGGGQYTLAGFNLVVDIKLMLSIAITISLFFFRISGSLRTWGNLFMSCFSSGIQPLELV